MQAALVGRCSVFWKHSRRGLCTGKVQHAPNGRTMQALWPGHDVARRRIWCGRKRAATQALGSAAACAQSRDHASALVMRTGTYGVRTSASGPAHKRRIMQ